MIKTSRSRVESSLVSFSASASFCRNAVNLSRWFCSVEFSTDVAARLSSNSVYRLLVVFFSSSSRFARRRVSVCNSHCLSSWLVTSASFCSSRVAVFELFTYCSLLVLMWSRILSNVASIVISGVDNKFAILPLNKSASDVAILNSCSNSAILAFNSSVAAFVSSVSAFADSHAVLAL